MCNWFWVRATAPFTARLIQSGQAPPALDSVKALVRQASAKWLGASGRSSAGSSIPVIRVVGISRYWWSPT